MAKPGSQLQRTPVARPVPGMGLLLRRLWPYTRKHRGLVAGALAAMLGTVLLKALEPWPLKYIFDSIIAKIGDGGVTDPAAVQTKLIIVAVGYLLLVGGRAVTSYASQVGFALVGTRVLSEVRAELFAHIQRLSLRFHSSSRNGDLTVRVISDVGMLRDVAVTALVPLGGNVLVLVLMIGLMFWMDVRLALLSLTVFPLMFLPTARLSKKIRKVSDVQRRREGKMAAMASESIAAIHTVKSLSLESTFDGAFSAQNSKSVKDGVKTRRLAAKLEGSVQFVTALGTALVLWYGTVLVIRGELTPGVLLVFLSYLKSAFRPLKDLAKYTGRLAKASAAAARVFDVLDESPDIQDEPGAIPAGRLEGRIEFENVSYVYDGGKPALSHVSFKIEPGQNVAVVGPSGAGKTTFISLVSRLFDPAEGRLLFDGRDAQAYQIESLRRNMGVVLQTPLLFKGSIRDNLLIGVESVDDQKIHAALELARAAEFVERLPDGLDTIIGERGVTLSVGQRQRLTIARLALRNTSILIYDEPASALDAPNSDAVYRALHELSRGKTSFLVTHDLDRALSADLILVLRNGHLVEAGTPAELDRSDSYFSVLRAGDNQLLRAGVEHELLHDQHLDGVTA